jgi:hypothetical protein
MLGIPYEEIWERVPGVTPQEMARWKAAAAKGDAIAQMNDILTRQMGPEPTPEF